MSPRPVSLLVWRDAKTDPPTGKWKRNVLVMAKDWASGRLRMGVWPARSVALDQGRTVPLWWSEEPILSDLTDEDMKTAAESVSTVTAMCAVEDPSDPGIPDLAACYARLRAALGGEKEEA